jgi:hypothetical protein
VVARALRQGLLEAFRRPKIALSLYALNLAVASALAIPATALLDEVLGRSTAAVGLEAGFRFETLVDFLGASSDRLTDHGRMAGVAALLYAVLASLLTGGVIDVLKGPPRSPFLPRLLGGAGRLAPRFLRLLAYLAAALAALYWIGRGLDVLIVAIFDQSPHEFAAFWAMRGKQALILVALLLVAAVFDLARVLTVLEDRTHMVGALLTATGFVARHAPGLLALYAGLAAAHLLLFVPYLFAAHRLTPAAAIVLPVALQQALMFLRHLLRVAGIASLLAYYRGATGAGLPEEEPAAAPATEAVSTGSVAVRAAAAAAVVLALLLLALAAPFAMGGGERAAAPATEAPAGEKAAVPAPGAGPPEVRLGPDAPAPARSRRVVSYDIEAALDPGTRTVSGRETVVYRNLTRTPMRDMKIYLHANAFSHDRTTYMRGIPWDDDLARRRLERLARDGAWAQMRVLEIRDAAGADLTAAATLDETVLTVPLPQPVPPGGAVTLRLAWETLLPRTYHRTGFWGEHYDVMQWYPKPAVWTDAGWKVYPFHRTSEFFADFGTFRATLTAPRGYVLEATGVPDEGRDNPDGTRSVTYRAEDVHDFAWIADRHAVLARDTLAEGPYAASPVEIVYMHRPDRARMAPRILAAARHGLLYYGERFGAYPYPRVVIDDLPMGVGGGMEYPMLFTVSMAAWLPRLYLAPEELTLHEFGHQYWYGLLASNEYEEPWLDEGINSYVTERAMLALRPPRPGRTLNALDHYLAARLLDEGVPLDLGFARLNLDRLLGFRDTPFRPTEGGLLGYPITPYRLDLPGLGDGGLLEARRSYAAVARDNAVATPSWAFHPGSYSPIVYDKTLVALETVGRLIGHDTLDRALGEYARRHRFAHPTTRDFLAVLRETAARERPDIDPAPVLEILFQETATVDFAVTSLRSREVGPPRGLLPPERAGLPPVDRRAAPAGAAPGAPAGAGPPPAARHETEVIVRRLGDARLPVELLVRFEDGSVARERWDGQATWKRFVYEREARAESAVVDPDAVYAIDTDRNNNGRLRERRVRPVARLATLWLFWLQNYLMLAAALS